jgi:hypothetical protein
VGEGFFVDKVSVKITRWVSIIVDFSVVVLVTVDGGVMTGTTMTALVTTTRDTVESGAWPLNQEVVPLS